MTASTAQSAINWFEIPCTDLQRAQTFYEAMLGRKMHREDLGGCVPMVLFAADDPATGGCLVGAGSIQPSNDKGVRIYLDCEPSVEAAMARASKAGGKVLDECVELPKDIGFIAHVRDTEGNTIGLHAKSR
ncbi:VOC family protein [Diaphorobacter sp. HDW4B]|uniref:VOC family protein n=1 Tax=Diaphorobacter sp. HDW4B TaxID=2714925 RepID=UPI00140D4E53|nr:VOC family protein [Diaphorobacter sp. HDW4B]QIL70725.1 VOC family protein [Diaphorobacter sp. HDW4B]